MVNKFTTKNKVNKSSDFTKKRAKVGRKVAKSNATNITVSSKRINIPLQNDISTGKDTVKYDLSSLLRQLKHYSTPNKVGALHGLKELILSDVSTEEIESNGLGKVGNKISLVFPDVLEVLSADERETRSAVIDLMSTVLRVYPSSSLLSVLELSVTYLCSGLTHLNKSIRKDTLMILSVFAEYHALVLMPYLEKIMKNVMRLFEDHLQLTSTVGSGSSRGNASSSQADSGKTTHPRNQGHSGSKMQSRPTIFMLIVRVLLHLLPICAQNRSERHNSAVYPSVTGATGVLVLRGKALRLQSSLLGSANENRGLSDSVLGELCERLRGVWRTLSSDHQDSSLSEDATTLLQELTRVIFMLGDLLKDSTAYQQLLLVCFHSFPYASLDHSTDTDVALKRIQLLNLSLCEIYCAYGTPVEVNDEKEEDGGKAGATGDSNAKSYLLDLLESAVQRVHTTLKDGTELSGDTSGTMSLLYRVITVSLSRRRDQAFLQVLLRTFHHLFQPFSQDCNYDPSIISAVKSALQPAVIGFCEVAGGSIEDSSVCGLLRTETLPSLLLCVFSTTAISLPQQALPLLASVISCTLLTLQTTHCENSEPNDSSEESQRLSVAFQALCAEYSGFYRVKLRGDYLYRLCDTDSRLQLLSCYYFLHLPNDAFLSLTREMMRVICSSAATAIEEKAHFLQLVYERRKELKLKDFLGVLFESNRIHIKGLCESQQSIAVGLEHERGLTSAIASILNNCRSGDTPSKLISVILPHIRRWNDPIVGQTQFFLFDAALSLIDQLVWPYTSSGLTQYSSEDLPFLRAVLPEMIQLATEICHKLITAKPHQSEGGEVSMRSLGAKREEILHSLALLGSVLHWVCSSHLSPSLLVECSDLAVPQEYWLAQRLFEHMSVDWQRGDASPIECRDTFESYKLFLRCLQCYDEEVAEALRNPFINIFERCLHCRDNCANKEEYREVTQSVEEFLISF